EDQHFAEGGPESFNMFAEVFIEFEIEFVQTTFLRGTSRKEAIFCCVPQHCGTELLIHQHAGFFPRYAGSHGGLQAVVDYTLKGANLVCLFLGRCALPAKHLLMECGTVVEGKNIKFLIKANCHCAYPLVFR